jgi:hypothetical protein
MEVVIVSELNKIKYKETRLRQAGFFLPEQENKTDELL